MLSRECSMLATATIYDGMCYAFSIEEQLITLALEVDWSSWLARPIDRAMIDDCQLSWSGHASYRRN